VIAYKFLQAGGVAPFTGARWAEGEAAEAQGALIPCRNGIHACRPQDLPYWLDDELWEVALEGEVVEGRLKVVARRGRLVRRVDGWNDETRAAFARMCLLRVAQHAADELRDAGLEAEADALAAATEPDAVAAASAAATAAAAAGGAGSAERLAAYAEDAVGWTAELPPSGIAYVAAHAADSRSRAESADAFAAERALQAGWLDDRLGLSRADA
jgi:hypothetical protein